MRELVEVAAVFLLLAAAIVLTQVNDPFVMSIGLTVILATPIVWVVWEIERGKP